MRKTLAGLGLLAALVLAAPADATVLFMGGEDTDISCYDSSHGIQKPVLVTTSDHFRSNYARAAIHIAQASTQNTLYTNCSATYIAASSDFWQSVQTYSNTPTAGTPFISFGSSDGVERLQVRENAAGTGFTLYSHNAAGTSTQLATESVLNVSTALVTKVDVHVNYTCSAVGSVDIYINSTQVIAFSGNPCTDAVTSLDHLVFYDIAANSSGIQTHNDYSEIVASTTDTRAWGLFTLYPNASGNTVAWTGTNPCTAILDVISYNDASYVYTDTAGLIEECAVYNTLPSGSFSVPAVSMSMRGLVGSTGPQNFNFTTRTGATDYFSADRALNNSFHHNGPYIQETNPGTATSWTTGDLTAAGFNIGLRSRP